MLALEGRRQVKLSFFYNKHNKITASAFLISIESLSIVFVWKLLNRGAVGLVLIWINIEWLIGGHHFSDADLGSYLIVL